MWLSTLRKLLRMLWYKSVLGMPLKRCNVWNNHPVLYSQVVPHCSVWHARGKKESQFNVAEESYNCKLRLCSQNVTPLEGWHTHPLEQSYHLMSIWRERAINLSSSLWHNRASFHHHHHHCEPAKKVQIAWDYRSVTDRWEDTEVEWHIGRVAHSSYLLCYSASLSKCTSSWI